MAKKFRTAEQEIRGLIIGTLEHQNTCFRSRIFIHEDGTLNQSVVDRINEIYAKWETPVIVGYGKIIVRGDGSSKQALLTMKTNTGRTAADIVL